MLQGELIILQGVLVILQGGLVILQGEKGWGLVILQGMLVILQGRMHKLTHHIIFYYINVYKEIA